MSLLDTLISKLAPHNCLACGTEGDLLCGACSDRLRPVPERCYHCQQLSAKSLTCAVCRQTSQLHSVQVAVIYETSAKALIWKLKLAGAQTAAIIMAKHMKKLIKKPIDGAIIVPVPTATSRVRQRGYDQAKLLARELSRQTRLPWRDCLARSGQMHQHGLPRHRRLTQLSTAFRTRQAKALRRAHVILVDDVVTTGATLKAAAAVLLTAGAARVDAIVFAQPNINV